MSDSREAPAEASGRISEIVDRAPSRDLRTTARLRPTGNVPLAFRRGAEPAVVGVMTSVSPRGLAVETAAVHPPGSRLALILQLPGGERSELSGTVVWARKPVPSPERPGLMGVRIERADEAFFAFLLRLSVQEAPQEPAGPLTPPYTRRPVAAESRPPPAPLQAIFESLQSSTAQVRGAPAEANRTTKSPSGVEPREPVHAPPAGGPAQPGRALPARFGTSRALPEFGVTTAVSPTAVALTVSKVHPIGTRLLVEMRASPSSVLRLAGIVVWAREPAGEEPLSGELVLKVESAGAPFYLFAGGPPAQAGTIAPRTEPPAPGNRDPV